MIVDAANWARQILSIGKVNLRRLGADRAAIGYLLMLPLLVTLLVGAAGHAASRQRVGVIVLSASPATTSIVNQLDASPALDVHHYATEPSLNRAVKTGDVLAGIVIRDEQPNSPTVHFVTDQGQGYPTTARLAVESAVGSLDTAPGTPQPAFVADRQATEAGYGQASRGDLLLFVFLSTVSGAGGVAATRRLGVGQRLIAAPISATQVVVGELLGRFVIAVVQAVFIVVAAWALFGIGWGTPIAVTTTIVLFGALSAAISVALGATVRTETQGLTIGIVIGLAAGMLGGCLWPLSIVGHTMAQIGGLFPHAWAMKALEAATRDQFDSHDLLLLLAATAIAVGIASHQITRRHHAGASGA